MIFLNILMNVKKPSASHYSGDSDQKAKHFLGYHLLILLNQMYTLEEHV